MRSGIIAGILFLGLGSAHGQLAYLDRHDFFGTITNADGKKGNDGADIAAGVTFDKAGNLYGTAPFGGANNGGLIWKMAAGGSYKDLYDFPAPNQVSPQAMGGVAIDASGDVFGTTTQGGSRGEGQIWEFTAAGAFNVLHEFGGTVTIASGKSGPDGTFPRGNVILDATGNLYGTCDGGGPSSYGGLVWKLTPSGKYTDLHDFGGSTTNANGKTGPDGASPLCGVTFDAAGNMYGTTNIGGAGSSAGAGAGIVWEITGGAKYKDLHDFGQTVTTSDGTAGNDGDNPDGGVAVDAGGNLYGTASVGGPINSAYGMVWEISKAGKYVDLHDFASQYILYGNGQTGPDGYEPGAGVTLDGSGNIFGTTRRGGFYGQESAAQDGIVFEITNGGAYLDLHDFGGKTTVANGSTGLDGLNPQANIAIDSVGDMYGTTYSGGGNSTASNPFGGMLWEIKSALKSLTVSPNAVVGSVEAKGTVTLESAAPTGGTIVNLVSGSTTVTVPPTVTVPANKTAAAFVVGTTTVAKGVTVTLTASIADAFVTASLTVNPPALKGISFDPTSVTGGTSSKGTVTLTGPAPTGGVTVTLASGSPSATVPATVIVAGGADSATFTVKTVPVSDPASVTITAKIGSAAVTGGLSIEPPTVASLALSPNSVAGGSTSTGTVTLDGPAPAGGTSVALSSSSSSATVPTSVTVGAGKTSMTFSASTSAVATQTAATVSAKTGTVSQKATLTIDPPTLSALTLSPSTVTGGSSSTGTVKITSPAPAAGLVITLSSSTSAAEVPASVTVASGKTSMTFKVATKTVSSSVTATIAAKNGSSSAKATLTIKS